MVELFCSDKMQAKYAREVGTSYERRTPLEVQSVAGGVVFPLRLSETNEPENNQYGGVCAADLQFVQLSLTKRVSPPNFQCNFYDWYKGANPGMSAEEIEYVDEEVVFIGAMPKHYGHFILEGLSRLWVYLEASNKRYRAVYISDEGEDRFLEFMKFFGLESGNIRKIEKPTRFRTVIVPEQSIRLHDYFHESYKLTVDRIKEAIEPASNEKVYFSKMERKNDRAIGEVPIENVLVQNGYAIYFPERMSLYETIAVLKGAKTFAATSGTNVHNAIFLGDGASSICFNRSAHFHPIQIMIDRMKRLRPVYVDAFVFGSGGNWSSGPFLLFPTKQVLAFLGSKKYGYGIWPLYKAYPVYFMRYMVRISRRAVIEALRPIYAKANSSQWRLMKVLTGLARKCL